MAHNSFTALAEFIAKGRSKTSRKLENNTVAHILDPERIAVRLHKTDILTFHKSGRVVVTTGGWKSVTTKDRLNSYLPAGFRVSQSKGLWYWTGGAVFTDGDYIGPNGTLYTQAKAGDEKEVLKLRKQVKEYAKKYAAAIPLELPSGGDCWGCLMRNPDTGKPAMDSGHILLHIQEGYVVPSLLVNALETCNAAPIVRAAAFKGGQSLHESYKGFVATQVARTVEKYVRTQLGLVR